MAIARGHDEQTGATRPGPPRLLPRVLDALRQGGHDPDELDPEALAGFEHFHTLGRRGTAALADAAAITSADHVLDVGCGVAGPARLLARARGCQVVGVDISADYLAVAADLDGRLGLRDRVTVCRADALQLPFAVATFDVVWSQHVAMSIADKGRLYAELRRVARPGARLALFDIVAGDSSDDNVHLPLPWATDASQNHLVTSATIRDLVERAGFRVSVFEDETRAVLEMPGRSDDDGDAALGLHLILGETLEVRQSNTERNFREGRIRLLRCVAVAGG